MEMIPEDFSSIPLQEIKFNDSDDFEDPLFAKSLENYKTSSTLSANLVNRKKNSCEQLLFCDEDTTLCCESSIKKGDYIVPVFKKTLLLSAKPNKGKSCANLWRGKTAISLKVEGFIESITIEKSPCAFQLAIDIPEYYKKRNGLNVRYAEGPMIFTDMSTETKSGDQMIKLRKNSVADHLKKRNVTSALSIYFGKIDKTYIENCLDFGTIENCWILFEGFLSDEILKNLFLLVKSYDIWRDLDGNGNFMLNRYF